jgi:cellulase
VNSTLCTDEATCSRNCVIEGTDYASHGVQTSGSALTLRQYLNGTSVSPRLYLLDNESQNYTMLRLLNQEFSFDVNVSTLVCGMNGALYLSEMSASGGRSTSAPAGASFGAGYCDAQCYAPPWINGVVNTNSLGACCTEMDIWEANAVATQLTPHPCTEPSIYACSGAACGSDGVCDKSGCGFNPYSMGNRGYYGYQGTVNTTTPFTVVTQFITDDHTSTGTLTEIRRLYVQNGKVIQNAVAQVSAGAVAGNSSITDRFCASVDSGFATRGGLETMGDALRRGMVLVFSIWNDNDQFMNWLDSGNAGPCNSTEGNPAIIEAQHPDTYVTFSNIKWGDLGSTYPWHSGKEDD